MSVNNLTTKEIPKVLTEEQKKIIDNNWDKINLSKLIKMVFNNPDLSGRNVVESKLVRDYLGDRKIKTYKYEKKPEVVLTEEQKEFVRNYCKTQNFVQMARVLFDNNSLGPLTLQCRAVNAYLKTLPFEVTGKVSDDLIDEEYQPPQSLKEMINKANYYLVKNYRESDINANVKKALETVIIFMKSPRYLQMINSYSSKQSREIFEGEMIRTCIDKPDLTSDEINLCVNLCMNYVEMIRLNRHKDMLAARYEDVLSDPESKLSVTLSDMIKAQSQELKYCDERISSIIKSLNGSRAERNKNKGNDTMSVANLIEMWRNEEDRKHMIRLAEAQRATVEEELDRLITLDDIHARLLGANRTELLNG